MAAANANANATATASSAAAATADSMAAYYARRAAYYERVYHRPERQAELRALEAWLGQLFAGRRVLEIAAGTGWWTPHGAARAAHWLATDLNPETLAVARAKALPPAVQLATVDAYSLAELDHLPAQATRFDAAFAGCWWSHVPLQHLPAWLATLHARLPAGAQVVMLDNRFVPTYSTPIHRQDAHGNTYQQRTLDDGSTHEVVKNFPTETSAVAALGPRARQLQLTPFTHYWVMRYTLSDAA